MEIKNVWKIIKGVIIGFVTTIIGFFLGFIRRKVLQDNRTADDSVRTDIGKLQDIGTELHNNNEQFEGFLSEIRENNKS